MSLIDIEDYPECTCDECADSCTHIPGIFDPVTIGEQEEIWDQCVEDWLLKYDLNISFLRPKTVNEAGYQAKLSPKAGDCVFLTPTGCSLSRDKMPIGCVTKYSCHRTKRLPSYGKQNCDIFWDNDVGHDVMRRYHDWIERNGGTWTTQEELDDKFKQELRDDPMAEFELMKNACPVQ